MLFGIDVGNTNITIGIFKNDDLMGTYRMTTKLPRTSDEYGIFFVDLLHKHNFKVGDIDAVIISSVVPNVMHSLTSGIIKYIQCQPVIVGPGIRTGIRIQTDNPKELGADRIVDAVAAYEIYGGPVLVIDYGTATTYDLVLEDGSFVAGVTSPGIRTSANALWRDAAKLPEIEIKKPDSIMAKNTISSMQAGLFYAALGETEYIVKRFKKESGLSNLKVVATGGLGNIIAGETKAINYYDSDLTLRGLKLVYDKQR